MCVRCRTNDCILSNRSPIQEKNVRLTCEYGIYIFLIFGQIVTNRSFFLCTVLFWYDSLSFGVMYIVTSTITFPAKVNIYIQSITLSFHRFCHCCCRSISPNALTAHSCSPFILESYFSSLNEDSSRMGYSETHSIQFWLELVAYHGMISLIHPWSRSAELDSNLHTWHDDLVLLQNQYSEYNRHYHLVRPWLC